MGHVEARRFAQAIERAARHVRHHLRAGRIETAESEARVALAGYADVVLPSGAWKKYEGVCAAGRIEDDASAG